MTNALTVIIAEATANASMRRFSASPSEKRPFPRRPGLGIPRHIAKGSHALGHSFAQLSWLR
jgi:hypothetical protein